MGKTVTLAQFKYKLTKLFREFPEMKIVGPGHLEETYLKPPGPSYDPGLTIGTSQQEFSVLDSDNPTMLTVRLQAATDGSTDGVVYFQVDEDGDGTQEFEGTARAPMQLGQGVKIQNTITYLVPAGAGVRIFNGAFSNPTGANGILENEAFKL